MKFASASSNTPLSPITLMCSLSVGLLALSSVLHYSKVSAGDDKVTTITFPSVEHAYYGVLGGYVYSPGVVFDKTASQPGTIDVDWSKYVLHAEDVELIKVSQMFDYNRRRFLTLFKFNKSRAYTGTEREKVTKRLSEVDSDAERLKSINEFLNDFYVVVPSKTSAQEGTFLSTASGDFHFDSSPGYAIDRVRQKYAITSTVFGDEGRRLKSVWNRLGDRSYKEGYFLYDSFDESGDLPYLLIESPEPMQRVDKHSQVVGVIYTDYIKPLRKFLFPPGISQHTYEAELIWHPGQQKILVVLGLWGNLSGLLSPNLQLNIFDVTASQSLDLTYEQFLEAFFAFPQHSESIHERPCGLRPMTILSPYSELYEHHPKADSRGCVCDSDHQLRSFADGEAGVGIALVPTDHLQSLEYFQYNFLEQRWLEYRGDDPQTKLWDNSSFGDPNRVFVTYTGVKYLPWKELRKQVEERLEHEKTKTVEILNSIQKETEEGLSRDKAISKVIYHSLLNDAERAAEQHTDLELVTDSSVWNAIEQLLESAPKQKQGELKSAIGQSIRNAIDTGIQQAQSRQ